MSRIALAYEAPDISALARTLRSHLTDSEQPPGHVEMLNILARAAGFRNFQHLRADAQARERMASPLAPPAPLPDHARCAKALRLFDGEGVLMRWPKKRNLQELCLWVMWSRLPARDVFPEKRMNALLNLEHAFGDYALLRREMVELGLFRRTPDGREYTRIERAPPPELSVLSAMLRAGKGSADR